MGGLKGLDRIPKDTQRARRNSVDLASNFDQALGDGLIISGGGVMSVDIVTNGGLIFTTGQLEVDEPNVDHDALNNFVADEHIDWTGTTENFDTSGTITSGDITIFNPSPILIFKDSTSAGIVARGIIEWRDLNHIRLGYFGNSSEGNDDLLWKNESSDGHIQVQTTGAGEFQIFANVDLGSNDLTTTGLGTFGNLDVDTLNLNGNVISDSGGTISFDDDDLTTTGSATIGGITCEGQLDVKFGGQTFIFGADNNATTRTNNTNKFSRVGVPHYDNTEEFVAVLVTTSASASNVISYGGSTVTMNAATQIEFYTAANNTTVTGTRRGYVSSGGVWVFEGNQLSGCGLITATGITAGASTFGDGGTTDYSQFEADGTLEFNGAATVWGDYVTPLGPNNWNGVSNNPTLTKLFDDGSGSQGVYGFVFSDGDEALITIQMPHDWKEGSTIQPHIHFMCRTDVTPADNFGIEFEYNWANLGDDFAANSTKTKVDISTGVNTNNNHRLEANVTVAGIDGTGKTISSILLCRIKRVAADSDNYLGGVAILDFDVHYEIDTIGSRQELVK